MTVEEKKFLDDVLFSIECVDKHLHHKRDFNLFFDDITIRRAVERELEIIGEAINHLLKLNPNVEITHARTIVDLRNRIIHAYDNINPQIIWRIVTKELPILQQEELVSSVWTKFSCAMSYQPTVCR